MIVDNRFPTNKVKTKRGFAAMDPKKQREIAAMGGRASHGGGRKKGSGMKKRKY
jgi:hypothetical protein